MTDLYDVLGITEDAKAADIKAAWKRAIKRAHPDAGGTREEFSKVQTALAVLSDPRRRERYDRTGRFDDHEPDNERSEFMATLTAILESIVELPDNHTTILAYKDVVDDVRQVVAVLRKQTRAEATRLTVERDRWQVLADRFVMAPHRSNPFRRIAERNVESRDEAIDKCGRVLGHADEIEKLLTDVTWRREQRSTDYGRVGGINDVWDMFRPAGY